MSFRHTSGQGAESVHAVEAGGSLGPTGGHQIMNMGQGFADGEEYLVVVEFAGEQVFQNIDAGRRFGTRHHRRLKALLMMVAHVGKAFEEPPERPIVAWQHQGVGGQTGEFIEAGEEQAERVGVRLLRPDADVRRDLRLYLVAGNQYAQIFAIQTGVLDGMALTDDHPPGAPANIDFVALEQPQESPRHR